MIARELTSDSLSLRFSAPWSIADHGVFVQSKALPEMAIDYDWQSDAYTLTAPARFAHILGLKPPVRLGLELPIADFLFDYQKWIVGLALKAKRYAIWSDCGTGKTPMQLEWALQVSHRTGGGKVLILAPLAVCHQTIEEAKKFYPQDESGMRPLFLSSRKALDQWCKAPVAAKGETPFAITNYEKFIPGVCNELKWLAGLVCDESSILKSGGGVIKWNLIKSARGIEYKLSCTATPAPNDTMEYASQASFLEKLRTEGEILWTFFHRDHKTQQWKVKPHAREAFYRFMSSWSIYLRKPAAYGFPDPFAAIPEPEISAGIVPPTPAQSALAREYLSSYDPDSLIPQPRLGMVQRSKLSQIAKGFRYVGEAKNRTVERIPSGKPKMIADLILAALRAERQCLVWTVFDEESKIIFEELGSRPAASLRVPECAVLSGATSEGDRLRLLDAFRHGEIRCLISKAQLLGYGLNFQFCTRMIFSGFDDSFERFYQAVRRCYRYGSTEQLKVHVPYVPGLEDHIWDNILRKRAQWETDIAEQESRYAELLKAPLTS